MTGIFFKIFANSPDRWNPVYEMYIHMGEGGYLFNRGGAFQHDALVSINRDRVRYKVHDF